MSWALAGLFLFVGAFLGVLMMALCAAAKNADDGWSWYERGYVDGQRERDETIDLPLSMN